VSARLEARGLACGYGGCAVLEDVDLEVRAGEVLALIGPNGAGKTTLLHTLARILRPIAGSVELEGTSIWMRRPREVARSVALAPQRAGQTAWPLTVEETVALGRAPHRGWLLPLTEADHAAVRGAMGRMGVTELANRTVSTLSGGEVRRVLLARALAQTPRVLLLDEPATYLDLHYQAELLGLVRTLAKEDGLAVVLTLHDLALVAPCADRVALVAGRRLAACGTPAEVLTTAVLAPVYGPHLEILVHPVTGAPVVLPRPVPGAVRG
jgi:iron complex transport system ATP-binding protein